MTTLNMLNLNAVRRSLYRGLVWRAPKWDPTVGPLELTHLADSEGDVVINTNSALAKLTVPELTGPAAHELDYEGEDPVIEIPMYVTDPDLMAIISPSGQASAGRDMRSQPIEHTLVIFPEPLFKKPDVNGVQQRVSLVFSAGAWLKDGLPLTAEETALLGFSFWAWRGVFNRPTLRFHGGAGDARKNIEPVTFQVMHDGGMPNGQHLYTIGDPADSGINLDGMS